jgi:hypothetical protein
MGSPNVGEYEGRVRRTHAARELRHRNRAVQNCHRITMAQDPADPSVRNSKAAHNTRIVQSSNNEVEVSSGENATLV